MFQALYRFGLDEGQTMLPSPNVQSLTNFVQSQDPIPDERIDHGEI